MTTFDRFRQWLFPSFTRENGCLLFALLMVLLTHEWCAYSLQAETTLVTTLSEKKASYTGGEDQASRLIAIVAYQTTQRHSVTIMKALTKLSFKGVCLQRMTQHDQYWQMNGKAASPFYLHAMLSEGADTFSLDAITQSAADLQFAFSNKGTST